MSATNINTIVDQINTYLEANLSYGNNRYYNLCFQQEKNDKTFIVTRQGQSEQGVLVSPDQLRNMIIYHRITGEAVQPAPGGKGRAMYQFNNTTVKLVAIGLRKYIPKNDNYYDNQHYAEEIVKLLNRLPKLDSKEIVVVTNYSSDIDAILSEEIPGQVYNHLKLEIVACSVEYTVKKRITGVC